MRNGEVCKPNITQWREVHQDIASKKQTPEFQYKAKELDHSIKKKMIGQTNELNSCCITAAILKDKSEIEAWNSGVGL